MVLSRIFLRQARREKCTNGDRFYKTEFVRKTSSPPLRMRVRNLTNHPSFSKILRKDGRGKWLFLNSPRRGILHEETFLLPSGRYRYLPKGLNASSDEWCRRSDTVLDGLPWAKKIVDDTLVWAPLIPELRIRVETIAHNCQKLIITLSQKKLELGKQIQFAGYLVGEDGVKPDPERIKAITPFPAPTNLTGVRSFLGLAQQLSFFISDFSHATTAIRQLLGKKKVFQWLPEHNQEFAGLKSILTANLLTRHFDPTKQVTLLTDTIPPPRHGLCPMPRSQRQQGNNHLWVKVIQTRPTTIHHDRTGMSGNHLGNTKNVSYI